MRPELPIRLVYQVMEGPFWRRLAKWKVDVYAEWQPFFEDVEMIDTFGDQTEFLLDAHGQAWDVRSEEFLMGNPERTVFAPRKGPLPTDLKELLS